MLTWADVALLTILAVSMGIGLWRGFIVEVLSLTVWIGAFWLSVAFGADVAAWLGGIASPSARLFLGHAGVFLVVLIVGGLLTWALGKFIANTGLSATDRVLGLGFGLARGVVLGCVAVLLLGFTPVPGDPWWSQSRLLPAFQHGAEWMAGFLPPAAAAEIQFPAPPAASGPVSPEPPAVAPEPAPET